MPATISPDTRVSPAIRDRLVDELRRARLDHDRARDAFAAPYSGRDAEITYVQARGYWQGIAHALELYDTDDATSSD